MPWAAKHPCPGLCGRLVASGYCEACAKQGKGKDQRPTAAQRGYGSRGQEGRKAYLREHPIAVDWFKRHEGRIYAAEVVDHIIPHRGDMKLFWDPANWQGLTK